MLNIQCRWPNAIVLPGAAGRSPNAGTATFRKLQKELSVDVTSSPRYGVVWHGIVWHGMV